MDNFPITQKILIASEWRFLGEGMAHLVLEYTGLQQKFLNKALVIYKKDHMEDYNSQSIKNINSQLIQLHLEILSHLDIIQKHRLKYQQLQISQTEKQRFLQNVKQKLQTSKRTRKQNNTIDEKMSFRICDNLFKFKMPKNTKQCIIIQFKPKSILYSKYKPQHINNLAEKLNIQSAKIVDILQNSTLQEKTKWHKIKLLKKQDNKNKMSPFDIFNHSAKNYLQNSLRCDVFEYGQSSSLEHIQNKDIYDKIINTALKKSRVFEQILSLQLLYDKSLLSFELFKIDLIQKLTKNIDLSQIKKHIVELLQSMDKKNIYDLISTITIQENSTEKQIQLQMMKMLISITWRDISLIVQVNLLDKYMQELPVGYELIKIQDVNAGVKISILDYNLKPVSRIQSHQLKQNSLLQKYIRTNLKN